MADVHVAPSLILPTAQMSLAELAAAPLMLAQIAVVEFTSAKPVPFQRPAGGRPRQPE